MSEYLQKYEDEMRANRQQQADAQERSDVENEIGSLRRDRDRLRAAMEQSLALADYIKPEYRKEADAIFNEIRTAIRKGA